MKINELYADMTDDDFNMLRGVLKEMRQRGMSFQERLVDTHDPYIWLEPPLETAAPPVRVYSIAGVVAWRAQPEVDGHPEGPAMSFDINGEAARILEMAADDVEDGKRDDMPTQDAATEQAIVKALDAIGDWAARHGWQRPRPLNKPNEEGAKSMNAKEAASGILFGTTGDSNSARGFTADRREVAVEAVSDGGFVVSCGRKMTAILPGDADSRALRSAISYVTEQ